ncbi:MAG: hypothetical protein OTJ44_05775 [Planctomycetota bacterium]|nr:hypothetical protein [Planctomycetota bacterium]
MLFLAPFLLAVPFLAQDRVLKTDGSSEVGTFASATLETVLLRRGKKEVSIPSGDVLRITFGKKPDAFVVAEAFLAKSEFQNAIHQFEVAAENAKAPWVAPMAELRGAEALLAWSAHDANRAEEALSAFTKWTATHPDHFWAPQARIGQAKATALSGDLDSATRQLQEVVDLAFNQKLGPHLEGLAKLTRCQIYLQANQATLARQRLEGAGGLITTLQDQSSDTQYAASVRDLLTKQLANAQVLLGDVIERIDGLSGAQRYWKGLLAHPGVLSPDVEAAGTIVLALAAQEAGKLREAQFLLAKVTATLPSGPDIQARALFRLGEICEKLDNNPAPGRFYYQEVLTNYPTSTWASQARRKLGL